MIDIFENKELYRASEAFTETPSNDHFSLHLHNHYEIFMLLEGDAKYMVEGNIYDLEPNDIIVIKKYQMHRVYHNSPAPFRRRVFFINPTFFKENNCAEYEEAFLNLSDKIGNKIVADTVKSSGLYDAFMRYKKYSSEYTDPYTPIVLSSLIEILYLINNIKMNPDQSSEMSNLKQIITYINSNFTKNITLDDLEKRFFISKYHLCHIFPKSTGLTVHQFITKKRLALAKELIDEGKGIIESAHLAGFNTYSSFYRAYLNEYKTPPKK